MTSANVGIAGSLDLFKLYGYTLSGSNPNTELSRILIQFDLDPLRDLVATTAIDTNHPSFNCKLKLFDVYGGQPTPCNFIVDVYALSASFDEGRGKDVVLYSDNDACNFLTATLNGATWASPGASSGGGPTDSCDYISGSLTSKRFVTGEEDLVVDVTQIVSSTLAGIYPDSGLRISYSSTLESDQHSYFVKRFASRSAYNNDKRPRLEIRYDDSVQDDTQLLMIGSPCTLFLYNSVNNSYTNILSASTPVVGSNCLNLLLSTEILSGTYTLAFTGSQHKNGINYVDGIYSATFVIPENDSTLKKKLIESGSIVFTPTWASLDNTVGYLTGSTLTLNQPIRSSKNEKYKRYVVTVTGLATTMFTNEKRTLRTNLFDYTSPLLTVTRLPVETPGIVVRDVHYQVRDANTDIVIIPFDLTYNSTRLSSDAEGMFFELDSENLTQDHSYVVDIMVTVNGNQQIYRNASSIFRVSNSQSLS